MTIKTLSVPCPICKKEVVMTKDSQYRPFCSARCKSIDFGDWALGNRKIPGEPASDHLESLSEIKYESPD